MKARTLLAAASLSIATVCVVALLARTGVAQVGSQTGAKSGAKERIYIGTYTKHGSKGIYTAEFDPSTGALSNLSLAAASVDPSFLAYHPKSSFLYAANESAGTVSAFAVDPGTGALRALNMRSSGGDGPCHVSLDESGRMLFVANYAGGTFSAFPVDDHGRIGAASAHFPFTGSGPDHARQEHPHAHSAYTTPGNRFVLVNDLGTDRTMVYSIDPKTAAVTPAKPPFAEANPGAGPRHLAFGVAGRYVYVLNEMQSSITKYGLDLKTGVLTKQETVSSLPAGFQGKSTAAEIEVSPDERRLYASNRGQDSIAVFNIGANGMLNAVQDISSGGHTPRSFSLDRSGRWLLAANQDSNSICVFRVDPHSGKLTAVGAPLAVSNPVCVLFQPRRR